MHEAIVYLVDDEEAIREAISLLLRQSGFEVEAYESGSAFLEKFQGGSTGCLLLDLCLPDMDGLEVQRELLIRKVHLPIIFMTAHGTIRDSVSAIKAGAFDFLEKPCSAEELVECLREALIQSAFNRSLDESQLELTQHYERLSPREREVMALISQGQSSKQIARVLSISPRTVDAHRARLLVKMQASSLAELGAMYALCQNMRA
jgi:FixJ family two-component response regulator